MMGVLIWFIENWKLLVSIALLLMAAAFGYDTGRLHVQRQWDSERAKLLIEIQKKSAQDAKKILELETTKNENTKRIDGLLANNHQLWLRVPKTPCGKPTDTPVGQPATPSTGPLYSVTPDPLEEYSREVGELLGQCDKIVESCRVNSDYLKSLQSK